MRSNSNRSMSSRLIRSITFFCGCSTNCRPQSRHLNRCLPLWIRPFFTVGEDAQIGQAGRSGNTSKNSTFRSLHLGHYPWSTTSTANTRVCKKKACRSQHRSRQSPGVNGSFRSQTPTESASNLSSGLPSQINRSDLSGLNYHSKY